MKKYFTIFILAFVLFPFKSYAALNVTSFSPDLSFSSTCQMTLEYSLEVVPSSIVSGNSYFVSVSPMVNGVFQSGGQDIPMVIPSNGIIPSQTHVLTGFQAGDYQVKIIENGPGQYGVNNLSIPPCENAGNINQQQSAGGLQSNFGTQDLPIDIDNPISANSIPDLVEKFLELLIKIGIPLLVIMIVYSGALYIFAHGNPGKISEAHKMLTYTLIGGAILLGSWALAELIRDTFINITALVEIFLA